MTRRAAGSPPIRPSVPDRQEAILAALRHCPLYFILDQSLLEVHEPLALALSVIKAGVRMLQLRIKTDLAGETERLAIDLRELTSSKGCLLIINDYLDLAQRVRADGVHLGEHDMPVAQARRLAPELITGATARTSEAAWQAEVDGADYIGCGSVFGSATKPGLPVIGLGGLDAINRYVSLPVVAIGGITEANCTDVMQARVAGFCSIEPFRSGDPAVTVRSFKKKCAALK